MVEIDDLNVWWHQILLEREYVIFQEWMGENNTTGVYEILVEHLLAQRVAGEHPGSPGGFL